MHIKKATGTVAAITGAMLGLITVTSAQAASLVFSPNPNPGDVIDFKFGGYTADNANVPTGDSGGREATWGVGYLTEIDDHSTGDTRIWNGDGGNAQNTSIEFVMYGIADKSFTPGTPGILQNVGCTVGAGCDGNIHIDFYAINGTDPVRGGSITPSDRTGFSTVTGISDVGTKIMSWVLAPGDLNNTGDTTTTLTQNVNDDVLPTTGSGIFLADCISGPSCSLFTGKQEQLNGLTNLFGDVRGTFTLQTCASSGEVDCVGGNFPNGFAGFINDPALTVAAAAQVPEPGTLALIGGGLLLVSGFARRKPRNNG